MYPGIGWLGFRERSDVPEDLVFYENYLGKRDATFTLNFSTGASMVLARYYNFVRFGQDGYRYVMETMQANARDLARRIAAIGEFRLVGGPDEEQLPLVAYQLDGAQNCDEFDLASQLAAERGWMVPAYTLPPRQGPAARARPQARKVRHRVLTRLRLRRPRHRSPDLRPRKRDYGASNSSCSSSRSKRRSTPRCWRRWSSCSRHVGPPGCSAPTSPAGWWSASASAS